MKMLSLQSWACSEFERLGHPSAKEIVTYLLEIEEESSIEEYLNAMLDSADPVHKNFMKEFLKRHSESKSNLGPGFYRKPDIGIDENDRCEKNKNKVKDEKPQMKTAPTTNVQAVTKKKTKFLSLYSEEGQNRDVILLPGRHKCECQASKHKLVNNCLKCGRIVCEQEGSGPCAFCQTLVTSKEEKEIISRGTKKSEALHNKLIHSKKIVDNLDENKSASKGLQKAIDHKNKLLEFDKTSEKRTKVYDDESDYFQSSSKWVNPADREKLQKLEEEIKRKKYDKSNRKYTIDLLGRKVLSEQEQNIYDPNDPRVKEILEDQTSDIYSFSENENLFYELNMLKPVYIDQGNSDPDSESRSFAGDMGRLQDRELQEMRDEGMCLSMHQPWASLLIAGVKIHEGRMWYSSHRGRLWIASAAKVPTPSEISQLEQTYKVLLPKESLKFPQHYPTGCLLGCVDVTDVLPQEEYRNQYPEGESDSPYVFICENPQEMVVKFPIKGQHKLYKLDPKVHEAAKKSLRNK